MVRVCPKRDAVCPHGMDCPYVIDEANCKPETTPRADKAPERIWVLPDYDDHTNPVSDDWSFGTWDATPSTSSATPYVPATALEAAQARIAELEAESLKAFEDGMAQGFKAARAEALEEAAFKAEREGVYPELNVWDGGPDWYKHGKRIAAAIRALKEKPNG